MIRNALLTAILAAGWCACSSTPEPAPTADILGGSHHTRTLTYVHMGNDQQKEKVDVYTLSDSADGLHFEDIVTSDAEVATVDCFWDATSCTTGTGNVICFSYTMSGTTLANLSSYADGTGTWAGKIRSMLPHAYHGCLQGHASAPMLYESFNASATCSNVDATDGAYVNYVNVDMFCATTCASGKFPCFVDCASGFIDEGCYPQSDCPQPGCNENTWCQQHSGLVCP